MEQPVHDPESVRYMAQTWLHGLMEHLGLASTVEASLTGPRSLYLQVRAEDASRIIGRHAQMLDAIQVIVNRMLRRQAGEGWTGVVDAEGYRERQQEKLVHEAIDAAARVEQTGRPFTFPAMGSAERKIIHRTLAPHERVETLSVDEDAHGGKRVMVRLKQAAPAAPAEAAEPPPPADAAGPV